jgi:hypothetical protein
LQNMSQFTDSWVIFLATGSTTTAPEWFDTPNGGPDGQPDCEGGHFPGPATTKILPLCIKAVWMGLMVIE